MKFTIATIHNAYGSMYVPDGKSVELELKKLNSSISLADINWLQPIDNNNHTADILFDNEIPKASNIESALYSYFTEQFDENSSILLWIPEFYEKFLFCKNYLIEKSVFELENTIFERVLNRMASEVDVLVFNLGNESLNKLGYSKFKKEKAVINEYKVRVEAFVISEESELFEGLLMQYSLNMIKHETDLNFDSMVNNVALVDQFKKHGKLENI